jgi:predicted nuclease with TOPRIM domain
MKRKKLANYSNLLDDFNFLNSSYYELKSSLDGLNSTYYDLLDMHSQLQSDYDDLESKHDTLTGDLSTTRNLSYALIITTIVFIATTVYLAARKPKRKPELKST